ncbi:MAG: hypothetical protein ACI89J_004265 [Hyphomicrobiaceae bacterium]
MLVYRLRDGNLISRRRIERASYDALAFRYIAANNHPDHDTLCALRKRCFERDQTPFVQVLGIALSAWCA